MMYIFCLAAANVLRLAVLPVQLLLMRTHLLYFVFINKSENFFATHRLLFVSNPGDMGCSVVQLATVWPARPEQSAVAVLSELSTPLYGPQDHRHKSPLPVGGGEKRRIVPVQSTTAGPHSHPRPLADKPPPNLAFPHGHDQLFSHQIRGHIWFPFCQIRGSFQMKLI
jgi:hypothetical protein